jgi:hypothetical protein
MTATLPPVNPTIWAAIISGGWAATVAAIGFAYNRVTASATLKAAQANALVSLDAAHDADLWAKKSEEYVEVNSKISDRRAQRSALLGLATGQGIEELRRHWDSAKRGADAEGWVDRDEVWVMASARLTTLPRHVVDALQGTNEAERIFKRELWEWRRR